MIGGEVDKSKAYIPDNNQITTFLNDSSLHSSVSKNKKERKMTKWDLYKYGIYMSVLGFCGIFSITSIIIMAGTKYMIFLPISIFFLIIFFFILRPASNLEKKLANYIEKYK